MDEDNDHLSCEFKVFFKKNKSHSSFRRKKHHKIRMIKKHKIKSKWKQSFGIAEVIVTWLNLDSCQTCLESKTYNAAFGCRYSATGIGIGIGYRWMQMFGWFRI
jgi:hypothetical protein